ncbi:hypothetical protein FKM82_007398 [Ascaphus truei]
MELRSPMEVHDLLGDYALKYCFVDKYKGTAFVTLLNGEQAESAIRRFHQTRLREREISVQLQPMDALLCIANLPDGYTQQQFEELVRPFGNMERCFLVYSETTGHPKGYGYVEYMKKDSAVRAKSDLLGRQLGFRTLYVHWSDVSQLSYELVHSRCLCVSQLRECEAGELLEAFNVYPPSFCQLAYGQDGHFKGFAVMEYDSTEVAEIVQEQMDGAELAGSVVRVSFCAPGPHGRSMLAALIAAQGMGTQALNRGNGLLPEPNILQILNSLGASASLQLLLNPLLHGAAGSKQGILGAAPTLRMLANPAISTALLQLLLQAPTQQKPGILGDSPLVSLYAALGLTPQPTPTPGKKLLADLGLGGSLPPVGLPSDLGASSLQPFLGQPGSEWDSGPGSDWDSGPGSEWGSGQGSPPMLGPMLSGRPKQGETGVSGWARPVREALSNKPGPFKQIVFGRRAAGTLAPSMQDPMLTTPSSAVPYDYQTELPPRMYSQNGDHTVPSMGGYEHRPKTSPPDRFRERPSSNLSASLPPFYPGSSSSYFTSGLHAGLQPAHLNKAVCRPPSSPGGVMMGFEDRSPSPGNLFKTPIGGHKRGFSHLIPSPEASPEGGYVGQHSQGLGGHYADSYLKRKRIF